MSNLTERARRHVKDNVFAVLNRVVAAEESPVGASHEDVEAFMRSIARPEVVAGVEALTRDNNGDFSNIFAYRSGTAFRLSRNGAGYTLNFTSDGYYSPKRSTYIGPLKPYVPREILMEEYASSYTCDVWYAFAQKLLRAQQKRDDARGTVGVVLSTFRTAGQLARVCPRLAAFLPAQVQPGGIRQSPLTPALESFLAKPETKDHVRDLDGLLALGSLLGENKPIVWTVSHWHPNISR